MTTWQFFLLLIGTGPVFCFEYWLFTLVLEWIEKWFTAAQYQPQKPMKFRQSARRR